MKEEEKETQVAVAEIAPAFDLKNFQCPHCGSKGDTLLLKEASFLTYIASIITLFLFGFFSIILLPLIIQSSKTVVRRCGDCYEILEQHDLFSLPSLSDEVMNFRCGNCALVISRKYLLVVFGILVVLYFYNAFINPPPPKYKVLADLTWEKYIEDCGKSVFINNGVRAKKNFEENYKNNYVMWEGAFINTQKKVDPFTSSVDHYHLYVKMIPTDSSGEYPDITFKYSHRFYRDHQMELEALKPGDIISFKGQFSHLGDEFSFHFLEMVEFTKTDQHVTIEHIPVYEPKETKAIGNLRKEK